MLKRFLLVLLGLVVSLALGVMNGYIIPIAEPASASDSPLSYRWENRFH